MLLGKKNFFYEKIDVNICICLVTLDRLETNNFLISNKVVISHNAFIEASVSELLIDLESHMHI